MTAQAATPRDPLRVATESFRPYWEDIRRLMCHRLGTAANYSFDVQAFCEMAKITRNEYELITRTMRKDDYHSLSFDLVDRVMVAAGMQHLVTSLYVVNERPELDTPEPPEQPEVQTSSPRMAAATAARSKAAYERRVSIHQMWHQGFTLQQIAEALGTSRKTISVAMARMREGGWDMPYRYDRSRNPQGLALTV